MSDRSLPLVAARPSARLSLRRRPLHICLRWRPELEQRLDALDVDDPAYLLRRWALSSALAHVPRVEG